MSNSPYEYPIDWEQQWADHARNFKDGFVHLPIDEQTALKLKPGPGFGDLSHPTTRLVLNLMGSKIRNKHIIDVGCGSGILSLAAKALGAASVHAIDIDPHAIEHTKLNIALNSMQGKITTGLPDDHSFLVKNRKYFVLMNMIHSEQVQAWNSLKGVQGKVQEAITSGILLEQLEEYVSLLNSWNLSFVEKLIEDQWVAIYSLAP